VERTGVRADVVFVRREDVHSTDSDHMECRQYVTESSEVDLVSYCSIARSTPGTTCMPKDLVFVLSIHTYRVAT